MDLKLTFDGGPSNVSYAALPEPFTPFCKPSSKKQSTNSAAVLPRMSPRFLSLWPILLATLAPPMRAESHTRASSEPGRLAHRNACCRFHHLRGFEEGWRMAHDHQGLARRHKGAHVAERNAHLHWCRRPNLEGRHAHDCFCPHDCPCCHAA